MKKLLLWNLFAILFFTSAIAQDIVTTRPQKKAVVLEEYTGINCPYCPQGHAAAEAIATSNPNKTFIINVHTGYYATPSAGQPDFRTSFGSALEGQTSLEGYPSGTVNRHYFADLSTGGGTALSRDAWSNAAQQIFDESSPVNVGVSTVYNPGTREVVITVEAYYVEGLPFGLNSNFIQVAILESNVIGYQAGASSSYNHKHILRDLVTGQWGEEIENIEQGTVVTKTYNYTLDEDFVAENCTVLAFITETRQEIVTGAEAPVIDGWNNGEIEPDYARLFADTNLDAGQVDQESQFNVTLINGLADAQNATLTLVHDAPEDWTVTFTFDGNDYTESASISLLGDEVKDVTINVTPGETVGVANCVLSLSSETYPAEDEKVAEVFVVSGVDNLIINGSGQNNNISSDDFTSVYKNGLSEAGCESYGAIPGSTLVQAADFGLLEDVKNIYMNVGGTIPVLTVDQTNVLTDFIDNGGNLLIAGQDVGFDIFGSGASSGSITQKLFFQNYLSVSLLNDGDAQNNSISSTVDSVYSGISGVALYNAYSGAFDPDAVKKYGNAQEVLFYPSGKAAAVKNYKGDARIVYFAFGLEQVQNADARNDLLDRTYRWFQGWEGSNVESNRLVDLSMYPNPVTNILTVDSQGEFEYSIINVSGQVVLQGISNGQITTSELPSGLYMIKVKSDIGESINKFTKD